MPSAETRPTLFSDVLGAMVSSIAQARQIADVAAVNLAYAYQRHELLRGMAVPRLRFRSIDVSLPVLIRQVHAAKKPELDSAQAIARRVAAEVQRRAGLTAQKLRFELETESPSQEQRIAAERAALFWGKASDDDMASCFRKSVEQQLEQRVIQYFALGAESPAAGSEAAVRAEAARAARSGVKTVFRDILRAPEASVTEELPAVCLDITAPLSPESSTTYRFSELKRTSPYAKILEAAAALASDTCFRTSSTPAELEMVVCTDDIKNTGGGPDSVTRIRFTLLEEGLEWVEDEQGNRLITE